MSDTFLALDDQDDKVFDKKNYKLFRSFLFLLNYTKGQRFNMFLAIVLLLIFSALAMYSGHAIGTLIGEGLVKKNWELAKKFSIIVITCEVLAMFFNYYGRKLLVFSSGKVILAIRKTLFIKLPNLPMSFFDRWPKGRIVTRLTHDVEGVESFFAGSLGKVLNSLFLALASMVAMLTTDFKLGVILISTMIPALMVVYFTKNYIDGLNRKMSKYSSQINSKLSEFIDGIYVIRSFGLESWSQDIFKSTVGKHVETSLKANMFYSFTNPIISFLCALPIVFLILLGGKEVMAGTMSIALFISFLRFSERFFNPVMILFREIHVILQAFTSVQRVANFLREQTEEDVFVGDKNKDIVSKQIKGDISFKNVWMSYNNDKWSLRDVSFDIKAGETIGIVGTTGSGKTTLISIISRLYDFQKGSVEIDGQSIKNWDLSNLRMQIGLVSQDVTIFQGSLRENLTVDPNLLDDHISNVCEVTGLMKVMKRTGLDLDSKISDGGVNLSAGEKQIISLTRTCLLNPQILILDEATANVDSFYEAILHDGIKTVMKNKTSFIIAHRLDTIKECDKLLVFDQGKLVEIGHPTQLLENKGVFYNLNKASITLD